MALKKNEQILLDSILQTANIVKGMVGNDINMINEKLADMLTGFYNESNKKLILSISEDGEISSRVADYKSDFVRTRSTPDNTMLSLRGKINGVPIEIKVFKDGVALSNKEVAEALMELSLIVSAMPVEMSVHGQDDWPREAGGMPKTLSDITTDEFLDSDEEEDDADEGTEPHLELDEPEPEVLDTEVESEQEESVQANKPVRRAAMSFEKTDTE